MAEIIDLFDAFSTDTKAEKEGTETTIPGCGDIKFLVARVPNPAYKRVLNSLYKRNRAVLDGNGDMAEAKSNDIMAEVFAKTVLVGWQGQIKIQGVMTNYSEAAAKKLLSLPDFREKVEIVASDFATFKAKQDEEDLGN